MGTLLFTINDYNEKWRICDCCEQPINKILMSGGNEKGICLKCKELIKQKESELYKKARKEAFEFVKNERKPYTMAVKKKNELTEIREKAGYTKTEMAKILEVTDRTIRNIENTDRPVQKVYVFAYKYVLEHYAKEK